MTTHTATQTLSTSTRPGRRRRIAGAARYQLAPGSPLYLVGDDSTARPQ